MFPTHLLQDLDAPVVEGRLCSRGPSTAKQWMYGLCPARHAALRTFGDSPTRSLPALAQRVGVVEVEAGPVITSLAQEPIFLATTPAEDSRGHASSPDDLGSGRAGVRPLRSRPGAVYWAYASGRIF